MAYRITNQVLGTTIIVDTLPPGVRVGVTDIGPVWNDRPAPKLIVEQITHQDVVDAYYAYLTREAAASFRQDNQAIWERGSKATA